MRKKIIDIFSYISEKEISLPEIEDLFYQSMNGIIRAAYKVSFTQKDLNLNTAQISASNDLQSEGKLVAYIVREKNEVIAIIGYRN